MGFTSSESVEVSNEPNGSRVVPGQNFWIEAADGCGLNLTLSTWNRQKVTLNITFA
jgi:hypothetical protein